MVPIRTRKSQREKSCRIGNGFCNKETVLDQKITICKYARILLFQFVFTKYVFGFRNYDGLTFVVIVVLKKNVIRRNYDKIRIRIITFLADLKVLMRNYDHIWYSASQLRPVPKPHVSMKYASVFVLMNTSKYA